VKRVGLAAWSSLGMVLRVLERDLRIARAFADRSIIGWQTRDRAAGRPG